MSIFDRGCLIMGCTTAKRANSSRFKNGTFSWHSIPCQRFHSQIRKQWINIIRKSRRDSNWVPTKNSNRICCMHFEPACIKYGIAQRMTLCNVSIPTLFLGGDDSQRNAAIDSSFQIFQSDFDPLEFQVPEGYIHCSVSDCANSAEASVPGRIFYKFPAPCLAEYVKRRSKNTRLQKWIEFAKRKDVNGQPWQPTSDSYICNEHFVRNCISDDPESPSYLPTIRTFHRNTMHNTIKVQMTCISCNEKYTNVLPSDSDDSDNSEHLILKMFVCKILKLDMKLIQSEGLIPFCSPCEEKIKYLQESHNELEALKNKIEKMEKQLLKDIISTYIIRNNLTESGNGTEKESREYINERILLKWNAYELHRKWDQENSYNMETRNDFPFIGDEDNFDIVSGEGSGRDNDDEDYKSESDDYAQEKFSCSLCSESFETEDNLKDHESTHSRKKTDKTFICGHCGKTCPNSHLLKRHIMLIHTKEKPFSCSQCEMAFSSKQQLGNHVMKVHTGERPFKCSICDKGFTASAFLKSHLLTHSEERPYTCETCGQMFKTSTSFKMHERIHNEGPYKCSICNKGFNYSSTLKRHLESHQKPPKEKLGPPFYCSVCGKSYPKNWLLVAHMRIHTGEKPYACSICDKKFAFSRNLKDHSKTHTGESPFGCSVCDKTFFQKKTLKQHMNIHTGDKPHLCSVCGQRFAQSSTLVGHLKTHSEPRPYSCAICGEMFRKSASLKKHEQIHGEKSEDLERQTEEAIL